MQWANLDWILVWKNKKYYRASRVVQWLRSTCQCREHEFDPWSRKIPRAAEQLSLCATTTEAHTLEHVLGIKDPPQWEASTPRWRVAPAHQN